MLFDFTPNTAAELLILLSPLLPIIATYLLGQTAWPKELKAALAFGLSAIVAFLTAYSTGALVENFWSNFFAIYTIAQGIYWTFFKALGLERWIAPKEAVAGIASNQVHVQVAALPAVDVRAALDPANPAQIVTDTKVSI